MASPPHKDKKDSGALPEETELITPPVNNVTAEYILFRELFTSYDDHVNNSKEDKERSEELFTSLVNIVGFPKSRKIGSFLRKYGAATQRELAEKLLITGATVSRTLNTLRICGIVEKRGRVGTPYRAPNDRGAGIPIWRLKYSSPQASIEAQKRYGDMVVHEREAAVEVESQQRVRESQQREAHEKALTLEAQDLADQVLSKLPRPHEKGKLTPINDTMTLVDIPDALRRRVRDIVSRILQEEEAEG